jgi:hypothetical protein
MRQIAIRRGKKNSIIIILKCYVRNLSRQDKIDREGARVRVISTIFKQNLLADQRDCLFKVIPFFVMGYE